MGAFRKFIMATVLDPGSATPALFGKFKLRLAAAARSATLAAMPRWVDTDELVDQIVCRLYGLCGLAPEETKIVEESAQ